MVFYKLIGGRLGAMRNFCAREIGNPLKSLV